MDACPRYLCTCVYVIVYMSARKKAPVNLLMCPFELYMFIGVSMQLRVVFKYDFLVLIPYCWSVALEKEKKKKKSTVFLEPIFYLSKYSLSDLYFNTHRLLIEFNGLWYSLAARQVFVAIANPDSLSFG